jgi:hypothetical protein
MVRRYARERLHRPGTKPLGQSKVARSWCGATWTRCATGRSAVIHRIASLTLRPLGRELRQLQLAHISQLANNGEYLSSGEKCKTSHGGSAIANSTPGPWAPLANALSCHQIGEVNVYGWQKRWRVQSHRGLGLHSLAGKSCLMDGWTTFMISSPSIGKRYCGDTGKSDKHVQARKTSVTEPKMQLPRFNDARAIPIFTREIFRESLKTKQPR